jgi:hypothetical protein
VVQDNAESLGITVRRSTSIRLKAFEENEIFLSLLPILTPTLASLEEIIGVEKDRKDLDLEGDIISLKKNQGEQERIMHT